MDIVELARRLGESVDDLRSWVSLGLLPEEETAKRFQRVRLIRYALDRGFSAETQAEVALTNGDMVGRIAEHLAATAGEPSCTVDEAAADVGIEQPVFERLRRAAGLGERDLAYRDDIEAIRQMKAALDAGLDPDVHAQILRVFADSTTKAADAATRLFHLYVHEQLRAEGSAGTELFERTTAISEQLVGLVEPAVVYFHRKAWARAWAEDMILHLAEDATEPSETPGEFVRAFLFVDLSAFTPMTAAMGDVAAAVVVERFSEIVREAAARYAGQVAKQIGDEFMLVFADGPAAVRCGLAIQQAAAGESQFPALRLGAHVGSVLYREGDYIGTTVNIAARVAGAAGRHQFLITKTLYDQLGGLDLDAEIMAVGMRSLKGLDDEVELFELRRRGAPVDKAADPVCGMEINESSAEAALTWQGYRLLFCSERCLRHFLADPARYRQSHPQRSARRPRA
jgi:class 3 adenylate cyclase/DNA-binding transcriptional MerR regulator